MFNNLITRTLSKFGYEKCTCGLAKGKRSGFVLFRYVKPDGSFDYSKYRLIQQEGNKAKLNLVWVIEENIAFLAEYLKSELKSVEFGICHGTVGARSRSGFENALAVR